MGRNRHPKRKRQLRDLARREAKRFPYDRVLIITEDSKSSLNYFEEIKKLERLNTANIHMTPSAFGTDPLSVVNYAAHLFENGDRYKKIEQKSFDRVFAVFDRDDHLNYKSALDKAQAFSNFYSDNGVNVRFKAIPSVPCFELWLLLHIQDIFEPIHRNLIYQRLKESSLLKGYEKNQTDIFTKTCHLLDDAHRRADTLRLKHEPYTKEDKPYTDIGKLVSILLNLKSSTQ